MAMEHIDRIFTRDLGDSASKARPEAWLTIERDHGHVEQCEFWRPRAASIEAADDRLHDRIERPSDFDDEALCSSRFRARSIAFCSISGWRTFARSSGCGPTRSPG